MLYDLNYFCLSMFALEKKSVHKDHIYLTLNIFEITLTVTRYTRHITIVNCPLLLLARYFHKKELQHSPRIIHTFSIQNPHAATRLSA